jgi:hypothetical protein
MQATLAEPVQADAVVDATRAAEPVELAILRGARSLIEAGWCKGTACQTRRFPDGAFRLEFCTVGAFNEAASRIRAPEGALQNAFIAFSRVNGLSDVPRWNDRFWRSKASVLRAFDRTIEHMEP